MSWRFQNRNVNYNNYPDGGYLCDPSIENCDDYEFCTQANNCCGLGSSFCDGGSGNSGSGLGGWVDVLGGILGGILGGNNSQQPYPYPYPQPQAQQAKKDNTALYLGIGFGALLIILLLIFFLTRK